MKRSICLLFVLTIGLSACSTLENRRALYHNQDRVGEYTLQLRTTTKPSWKQRDHYVTRPADAPIHRGSPRSR